MKHIKDDCTSNHMIISDCCGLGCANCGACKRSCNDGEGITKAQERKRLEADGRMDQIMKKYGYKRTITN